MAQARPLCCPSTGGKPQPMSGPTGRQPYCDSSQTLRIGAGKHLLGQVNPHWGRLLTCPNAPYPAPMPRSAQTPRGSGLAAHQPRLAEQEDAPWNTAECVPVHSPCPVEQIGTPVKHGPKPTDAEAVPNEWDARRGEGTRPPPRRPRAQEDRGFSRTGPGQWDARRGDGTGPHGRGSHQDARWRVERIGNRSPRTWRPPPVEHGPSPRHHGHRRTRTPIAQTRAGGTAHATTGTGGPGPRWDPGLVSLRRTTRRAP